jgi:hypothetical protein
MNECSAPTAPTLEVVRAAFARIVAEEGLGDRRLAVRARPLDPAEAIGRPARRDYPILTGVERVIEAFVVDARGQAFTDGAGHEPRARAVPGRPQRDPAAPRDDRGDGALPRRGPGALRG